MSKSPPLRLRGFRGATTVERDQPEEILAATDELLGALVEANAMDPSDIVSAIFTVTPDLVSTFPARASRPYGWDQVAILHATEIPVPGSMPRCIRVLVHAYSSLAPDQIKHCYLRRATALRPDRAV
jgi:chorismate mutase